MRNLETPPAVPPKPAAESEPAPPAFESIAFEFEKAAAFGRPENKENEERLKRYLKDLVDQKFKDGGLKHGDEEAFFGYLSKKVGGAKKIIEDVSSGYFVKITSPEERKKAEEQIPNEAFSAHNELEQFGNFVGDVTLPKAEEKVEQYARGIINKTLEKYPFPADKEKLISELEKLRASAPKNKFGELVARALEDERRSIETVLK